MRLKQPSWIVGALVTVLTLVLLVYFLVPRPASPRDDPWANMPKHPVHTDHKGLFPGEFTTGPEVTQACLACHPDAAQEMMATSHWTWESGPVTLPGREVAVYGGKKNVINNFCIGVMPNLPPCTACHAGYGWEDQSFDFADETKVDCLVCHDTSGGYIKANGGYPAESVDLKSVAESVGNPTRANCGNCHFAGGGGDAAKHGDLDSSINFPSENLDVHMGKYDFGCTDCHRTEQHTIAGRSITVSLDDAGQVYCTDCHNAQPHEDARINDHADTVACQTCHIPSFARKLETKMAWDWSQAGQDRPDDPHEYLKIKGSFIYEENVTPTYAWYAGTTERYIAGDSIDPTTVTVLNQPVGGIKVPEAKIFPFKVHLANQIYDAENNYLLIPKTYGEGGYWTDFDWDQAATLGVAMTGMEYSGEYGFAKTSMYWPITHMVAPAADALQCTACHTQDGSAGRLDWATLGYAGDPMIYGGRTAPARQAQSQGEVTP